MSEIWATINDQYSVSNLGRIYSAGYGILTPFFNNKGYPMVTISGKHCLVHRLVAQAFIPNPSNRPHVNHIDNDPSNPRADNLEWTTRLENAAHMVQQNRHHHAERHWKAKLTAGEVIGIRQRRASGESCMSIAADFGLHPNSVYNLSKGRTWKQLPLYSASVKV